MKKIITLFVVTTMLLVSCGKSDKQSNAALQEKKAQLKKLEDQKAQTETQIQKLQEEINKLEGGTNLANVKLVAVTSVLSQNFNHSIDLRGRVDAENISYVAPRGMGGQVKDIFVQEGEVVRKGQLLLKLDDAIMRQALAAARQQLEGIKTQLNFAKTLYEKQNNLWQKGIGTEVQLISAKTNVEALQNQLTAAEEQVKVAAEQLNTTNVYSDVDGVAETVMVKRGELFAGMGQIKIVNTNQLKVVAIVAENYISRVKKGTPVIIEIPGTGETFKSTINLVGQTIENTQRGFVVEANLPSSNLVKPNQTVVMKIADYSASAAIVIPVNTLQSDEQNKYVYVMEKKADGKNIATRKIVQIGEIYGDAVEIKSGLTGGELLITTGYQNLYEGQTVSTTNN